MNHTKGFFVALEGGEACGKTTVVPWLAERLRESGRTVVTVHEPGASEVGQAIRSVIMGHHRTMELNALIALFMATKIELIEKTIKPALEDGCIVVSDRYTGSLMAYQGVIRGHGVGRIIQKLAAFDALLQPHLNVLMECRPEVSLARLQARAAAGGEVNSMDTFDLEEHARIAKAYDTVFLELRARWPHLPQLIVNTSDLSLDEVFERLYAGVHRHMLHTFQGQSLATEAAHG